MRLRFHAFFVLAAVCMAATAFAQTQMPVKPGLWESTMTSTVSGMQITPEMQARMAQMPPETQEKLRAMMGGGAPRVIVSHSCLTQDQFEKWNDSFSEGKDKNRQCTRSNVVQSAHERSFDVACTSPNSTSKGHVQMFFDGDEKAHGTVHMENTNARQPQPIVIDMKIDTHFIGPDCGNIKPGEGELVKQ